MKIYSIASSLVVLGAIAAFQTLPAATINFDSNADYDDNFWVPAGANPGSIIRDSNGYLEKTGSSAGAAIYNTNAMGGSGGTGGTSGGLPLNTISDFTIAADFSTSQLFGGNSLGFYTKLNDSVTSGYVAFFRVTSATNADFRVFEGANASTSGAGTQIGSTLNFTTGGNFSVDTFYTFELDVEDVGGNVQFTASMFDSLGDQIGSTRVITDTTSAVTGAGQVGIRMNSAGAGSNVRLDSFSINAIPEPTSTSLLIGGLVMIVMRRKSSQSSN